MYFGFNKADESENVDIQPGQILFCEGKDVAMALENELNKQGIITSRRCNEIGMWSIEILMTPEMKG